MSIVNINGRKIDIEGYDTMSPEDQQSAQDEITGQLGQHEQAAQELNQQQKANAEPSWQQNPYIAGPVSAAVDTAKMAYEHPLAAAGVATALATAASKIPVVGPAVGNALGRVAGAFVPQQVQRAATGLSTLASGVTNGVNQWGQNVATTAAQKTNTSNLVHYNNIQDRISRLGDKADPKDRELADKLHSQLMGTADQAEQAEQAEQAAQQAKQAEQAAQQAQQAEQYEQAQRVAQAAQQEQQMAQTAANAAKISGPASGEGVTFIQRMAKQFGGMAQQVAPILNNPVINNPVTRGVAKLGGVGPQFATYMPGLNTNEEAELARRRGMGATIKPFGQ